MAPTFTFKLGTLDLSTYCRMNPDDSFDPYSTSFVEPAFADTPFSDGQVLISTTVQNREMHIPLFISDATKTKDALHALVQSINNAAAQRPLVVEWRDDGASASSFFDVSFMRFEPSFNFRRSQRGYAAGVLHLYTTGFAHTGTTRVTATAAGTGIFLSVAIASLAGDAPALLDTTIVSGAVVPSLGRIIALAPITNPSYAARIPAASLTDLQTNAVVVGASGADGSQYLALPVSPTGGASGIACKIPLPNPTIAGGDNRILAVVKSGIDAGVGIYALDPYGNSMGATAVASNSAGWALVDLGVCRLPTVGFPTQPKISLNAGAIWASGAAGPLVLASPAALAVNEIFCLPDKNLTLVYERGAGAGVLSKDGFLSGAITPLPPDDFANAWTTAQNLTAPSALSAPGLNLKQDAAGYARRALNPQAFGSQTDAQALAGILDDSMVISGKVNVRFPSMADEEVRFFKDIGASQFVEARFSAFSGGYLSLNCATNTAVANVIASVAFPSIVPFAKYRMGLRLVGGQVTVSVVKDDGGAIFPAAASSAFASLGASLLALAGAGNPAVAFTIPSFTPAINVASMPTAELRTWEVDTIGSSNILPYDSYRVDGPNADSYRTSSAGAFAGQKLVSVQRGAFPKMVPSTVSLAVVCAPVDQGAANDLISAVVSCRERFTYGR